jgi:glycosyltransferase involved in cell wall biosynthesis
VRALPEVRQAHVIVVGDGPEMGALRQLAERLGVSGRVHHAGGVPSLEVPRWMAALDVLALPSRTTPGWAEQFGRVLVEAMACEVPVVASDSGAIPEVVDGAGRIVPEASVGELARALGELLADPRERRRLGRLGRARVLERFTHQRVVDAQVVFYGAVVDGRRPGRPGGGRARPNVRPAREAAR